MPPFIGILSAAEAGEHPHCPYSLSIHSILTASSEWELTRITYAGIKA